MDKIQFILIFTKIERYQKLILIKTAKTLTEPITTQKLRRTNLNAIDDREAALESAF